MPSPIALCPRCQQDYYLNADANPSEDDKRKALESGVQYPALSRSDNETYICGKCGLDEAMGQFADGFIADKFMWPVNRSHVVEEIEDAADALRIRLIDEDNA